MPALILAFVLFVVGATAAAQNRQPEVAKACEADIKAVCPGVAKGEGRIARCLRENQDKLSVSCKDHLQEAGARMKEKQRKGGGAPAS